MWEGSLETPRTSSRPPLMARQQEWLIGHIVGSAPQNSLPRNVRRERVSLWEPSSEGPLHLLLCKLPSHCRGHPAFLSCRKAGTGQPVCQGSKTISHEGQHVVPGLCQPKEQCCLWETQRATVLASFFFFFSFFKNCKSPKLTVEITKAPRRLSRRRQSFHL